MLLLISERVELFRALSASLQERGVYLLCAAFENAMFLCEKHDTGGVLLDCTQRIDLGEDTCRELRKLYPQMPIAAIVPLQSIPDLPADAILRDADFSTLANGAYEFCLLAGWSDKPLQTDALTVGLSPAQTVYMGYPLPLSPRAHNIVRCLFYRAPRLTTADELMSLCYPCEYKSISNLAVQIHEINKRASKIDPRPLIVNHYGKGYCLRDGIL